jgi:hypothetical protein
MKVTSRRSLGSRRYPRTVRLRRGQPDADRLWEKRGACIAKLPKSRRAEVDLSHPSQRDRCRQILHSGEKSLWEDRSVKTQGFLKVGVPKSSQSSVGRDVWQKICHFGGSHSGRKGDVLDKNFRRPESQSSSESSDS